MTADDLTNEILSIIDDRIESLPLITAFDTLVLVKYGIENRLAGLKVDIWRAR